MSGIFRLKELRFEKSLWKPYITSKVKMSGVSMIHQKWKEPKMDIFALLVLIYPVII